VNATDPGIGQRTGGHIDLHERYLRTARTLRASDDPQELLEAVVSGLLDLDLGEDGDRVSLHLTAGTAIDVVAILPATRPRTSSDLARRAVERAELVVREDPGGSVVAAPLVLESRGLGAVVVRRPAGRPLPDTAAVELAAVLLANATSTVRWIGTQRELDAARADFVARVSHELRTPLTIISGFASTLGMQGEDLSEEVRNTMLDRIVTASVRLEHLVEELLTLASAELGHRTPQPTDCVVRDVLDLVVRDQGGADRTDVDCAPDLRVVTDPVLARLVLGPVIENALHHGQRVAVQATRRSEGVRITIRDDGPGVPHELGDRIFGRFVRGDDRRPGLGLGLATASQIGDVIGARVSLEEAEVGACFQVDLPDVTA
jgi:signal transduction histidine kinase